MIEAPRLLPTQNVGGFVLLSTLTRRMFVDRGRRYSTISPVLVFRRTAGGCSRKLDRAERGPVDHKNSRRWRAPQEVAIVLRRDVHGDRLVAGTERTALPAVNRKRERRRIADPEHGFVMHVDCLMVSRLHQPIDNAGAVNRRRKPAEAPRVDFEVQQICLGCDGRCRRTRSGGRGFSASRSGGRRSSSRRRRSRRLARRWGTRERKGRR
jgi:hypothetical protein